MASAYASTARSTGVYASEVCQAVMPAIFAGSALRPRSAWTCWENTNLLPTAQPMRDWASSRSTPSSLRSGLRYRMNPATACSMMSGDSA